MNEIFFTSDHHFGHEDIIQFSRRYFATNVEEMNERLIENWNKTVSKKDTVYHLGDFSWVNPKPFLSRLNGEIIMIQGNHDKRNWGMPYLEKIFGKRKIVMFHYPIDDWNHKRYGSVHLHGHTHSPMICDPKIPNRINVCVEAWDYTPVSLGQIEEKTYGE